MNILLLSLLLAPAAGYAPVASRGGVVGGGARAAVRRAGVPVLAADDRASSAPATAAPPKPQKESLIPEEPTMMDWINNAPFAMSKSLARQTLLSEQMEPTPLPPIWDFFW